MTRLWLVPFSELDTRRLRAQHREYHSIAAKIARGAKWKDWERPEHRTFFLELHLELMQELHLRGMTTINCAPNIFPEPTLMPQEPYHDPTRTVDDDRWTLMCRWDGVFNGRWADAMVREKYDVLELVYKANGGCVHDKDWQTLGRDRELCLLCKRVERNKKTKEITPYVVV